MGVIFQDRELGQHIPQEQEANPFASLSFDERQQIVKRLIERLKAEDEEEGEANDQD